MRPGIVGIMRKILAKALAVLVAPPALQNACQSFYGSAVIMNVPL
jgi:hypothetical protein